MGGTGWAVEGSRVTVSMDKLGLVGTDCKTVGNCDWEFGNENFPRQKSHFCLLSWNLKQIKCNLHC
jgi:fumarylacetoacetate (FAA) hydrolase family protein